MAKSYPMWIEHAAVKGGILPRQHGSAYPESHSSLARPQREATQQQFAVFEALIQQAAPLIPKWKEIRSSDLVALNNLIRQNVPAIYPGPRGELKLPDPSTCPLKESSGYHKGIRCTSNTCRFVRRQKGQS